MPLPLFSYGAPAAVTHPAGVRRGRLHGLGKSRGLYLLVAGRLSAHASSGVEGCFRRSGSGARVRATRVWNPGCGDAGGKPVPSSARTFEPDAGAAAVREGLKTRPLATVSAVQRPLLIV